jgi:hypothetical protein
MSLELIERKKLICLIGVMLLVAIAVCGCGEAPQPEQYHFSVYVEDLDNYTDGNVTEILLPMPMVDAESPFTEKNIREL